VARRASGSPGAVAAGTARDDPSHARRALKIGEVAREAGVPVGTVKFYLREGLLPPPLSSGRNIAYYPVETIARIRLVKELQEKRFLPLKVIRALVAPSAARGEGAGGADAKLGAVRSALSAAAELTLAGLGAEGGAEARRGALSLAGDALTRDERRLLADEGILDADGGDARWAASDARIVRAIADLRALGFTRRRGFGAERLLVYSRAVRALVAEELETALSDVVEKLPPEEAPLMLSRAIDLIGVVIAELRRKALLDMIAALTPPAV